VELQKKDFAANFVMKNKIEKMMMASSSSVSHLGIPCHKM
jgi:hypothetical protein